MRRCHPASGSRPALNLRCFVASRFPLLRPAESQPPFQGNLSEGSVLFIEFLLFYHLRRLERKHVLANMASMEQNSQFWTDRRLPGSYPEMGFWEAGNAAEAVRKVFVTL